MNVIKGTRVVIKFIIHELANQHHCFTFYNIVTTGMGTQGTVQGYVVVFVAKGCKALVAISSFLVYAGTGAR